MATDDRYIAGLRDDLLAVFEEARKEDAPPNMISFPDKEWRIFATGSIHFLYRRPETAAGVEKLNAKIYNRSEWERKWSGVYIGTVFSRAMDKIGDGSPERIYNAFAGMAQELDEKPQTWSVFFAVGGVSLSQDEIRLGSIRFFRMEAERERFRSKFYAIIDTITNPEEFKERSRRLTDEFLEVYGNLTTVEVPAVGDVEGAKEIAKNASEPVLDFLQLIAAIEEPSAKEIRIVAGGDLLTRQPPRFVIASDGTEAHWDQKLAWGFRLELTTQRTEKMLNLGFQATVDALSKSEEERGEFEKMLLNAIHWIADAETQERAENQITSYTTAMELFFTSEHGPIVRDLSEGIAYLLGNDLEHRKRIKRLVARLYRERSKVSHTGERATLEKDVHELKVLSINVVALMSRMSAKFKSKEDVRKFFSDLRLSAKFDPFGTKEEAEQNATT